MKYEKAIEKIDKYSNLIKFNAAFSVEIDSNFRVNSLSLLILLYNLNNFNALILLNSLLKNGLNPN